MNHLFVIPILILSTSRASPITSISGDVNINIDKSNIQLPTISPKAFTVLPGFPESGRTRAVMEQESLLGKIDSTYSKAQKFVADLLHPKPVIDSVREEDKYGNDGEKFKTVGRAVVNGYEAFSNALNAILDFPVIKVKQFGKSITANLNAVGGKLVGL